MYIFNHLATIVILSGSLTAVLGAQTVEQIAIDLQEAQNAITNADDDAKTINNAVTGATTYTTVVNNNNQIAATIKGFDNNLEGTKTFPEAQQRELVESTSPFADDLTDYLNTLADKASDFALESEREAVQDSVDNLVDVVDEYFKDLEALGTASGEIIETQAQDFDQAREQLDDEYEATVI